MYYVIGGYLADNDDRVVPFTGTYAPDELSGMILPLYEQVVNFLASLGFEDVEIYVERIGS